MSSASIPSARALSACILCGEQQVEEFLDLGRTALANKFVKRELLPKPEPKYPLRVGFCHACGHIQLTEAVPPGEMFEDYLYISSASETLQRHFRDLSDVLVQRHRLGPDDLVVDIGCNDGTLLGAFQKHGVRTLGVDPSENLAGYMDRLGIDRYTTFFNTLSAREIVSCWGHATLITTTNTFPHIPELQ